MLNAATVVMVVKVRMVIVIFMVVFSA